jgi:anti-anti-sigma regulatory factor
MSCRIERLVGEPDIVVLRVSGRIDGVHVDTLRELIGREMSKLAIDLRDVTLVNREAISLLAQSEATGIELRNCADYIGEWVARERRRGDGSDRKTGAGDDR